MLRSSMGQDKHTCALVVRCHNPTDAALDRVADWIVSVGDSMQVVLSIDNTRVHSFGFLRWIHGVVWSSLD